MTTELLKIGNYTVRSSITKNERPDGSYQLKLESNYLDSKNPDDWRAMVSITCERQGIELLKQEICSALEGS